MKRKIIFGILALFVLFAFLACDPYSYDPDLEGGEVSAEIAEVAELFISDNDNPDILVFETNDRAYWSESGFTLWALLDDEQPDFTSLKARMSKSSGNEWAGYGLIFCQYEHSDPGIGETILTVLVNNRREFLVGEVINGIFSRFCDWTYHEALNAGSGVVNVVEVIESAGQFDLIINTVNVYSFSDDEAPFHSGGKSGLIVVISPQDQFPETPVRVEFELLP